MKTALVAALFCVSAASARAGDDPVAIARSVGERFAKGCGAADVEGVLALYRDDARVVYPGAGQSATNPSELRKLVTETCVKDGPKFTLVGYRAVWVDAARTVVAALGDWSMSATAPDGTPTTTPLRAVEVLAKTPKGWQYVADHASIGAPPPPAEPGAPK